MWIRRPKQKPPPASVVNWAHPLTHNAPNATAGRRLLGCYLFNTPVHTGNPAGLWGIVNLCAPATPVSSLDSANRGTRSSVGQMEGMQFTAASTQEIHDLSGTLTYNFLSSFSVLCAYRLASIPASGNFMALVARDDRSGVNPSSWALDISNISGSGLLTGINFWFNTPPNLKNYVGEGRTPVAGEQYQALGVYDATAATMKIYRNGLLTATTTATDTSIPSTVNTMYVGAFSNNSSNLDGWIYYVYLWNGVVNAAEALWLQEEPFDFLQPQAVERKYWYYLPAAAPWHPYGTVSQPTGHYRPDIVSV